MIDPIVKPSTATKLPPALSPVTLPVGESGWTNPGPAYFAQVATDQYDRASGVGNPIGIPGNLYAHPKRSLAMWDESPTGGIPLAEFKRGDEVWIQWIMGVICGLPRMDCADWIAPGWSQSVLTLIAGLRDKGVRVVMYTPSLQRTPSPAVARYCLSCLVNWAISAGFDLCIDEGGSASDFRADLSNAGYTLRFSGCRLYLEGQLLPDIRAALGYGLHGQFLERKSVERSFTDASNPDWSKGVRPDPSRLVIWDNVDKGSWSTPGIAASLTQGLGQVRSLQKLSTASAIGAETWKIGAVGGPRLLVSRQDSEARRLLGVPA